MISANKSKNIKFVEFKNKYHLLKELMDFIPDVIYFKDIKGRFIMVNQAHAKGLGVKPEALVGKTDFDLFLKDRAKVMAEDDARVMTTGKPIIDKVERATRADGVDNYVSTTKIPRYNHNGKIVGLIGITRDITRRMQFERLRKDKISIEKKLESLEEISAMKSEFVSTVSHELRTPLAVIKQLVAIVYNGVVGKISFKQKEALGKALVNADRLMKIINDLLDISRIERNTLKLRYTLVDIVDLLKNSAGYFIKLAQEKNISLRYSYPKGVVNVFVDVDRINQVVVNLINNAIKFSTENSTIKVEVKILESKIRIGVIDTGIGISKADLPWVFKKFTQVSKIVSAENRGLGLGLSICKQLVEKHKGEIWVESKVGVGSKFYFTLLRFYTIDMLDKNVKDRINSLLKNGVSVHFVSLLILNYNEFKKRIKTEPEAIFRDLRVILDLIVKKVRFRLGHKQIMSIIDSKTGKLSIVLPGATNSQALNISSMLKHKIKQYFINNKIENVFISIGSLSYPKKVALHEDGFSSSRFSIKEIYVGSEMRYYKRMLFETKIKLHLPSGEEESADSIDISEGGICLKINKLLKTDMRLKLSFYLSKNKNIIILTKARVTWIKEMGLLPEEKRSYKVGLEFVNLSDKFRRIIRREVNGQFYKN